MERKKFFTIPKWNNKNQINLKLGMLLYSEAQTFLFTVVLRGLSLRSGWKRMSEGNSDCSEVLPSLQIMGPWGQSLKSHLYLLQHVFLMAFLRQQNHLPLSGNFRKLLVGVWDQVRCSPICARHSSNLVLKFSIPPRWEHRGRERKVWSQRVGRHPRQWGHGSVSPVDSKVWFYWFVNEVSSLPCM